MNRTKKFFEDIYCNRRKISVVLMMVLVIPVFQNCAGGFSSSSNDSAGAGALGTGSVGGTGAGGAGTGTGGSAGPTLDEVQKACKALITTPSLSAPSLSSVMVNSGLGSSDSGDEKNPASITISSNRGVTNAAAFDAGNCNAQFSLQLDCEVVDNDANRPISMTNAISRTGANLMSSTQMNLARNSFSNANCSAGFAVGASSVTFTVRPNTNAQRCSEGTFTIRLTARNAVTGQGAGFTSAPQYLAVRMNNACWRESKLTDPAGDLPAVGNFGSAVAIDGAWAASVSPTDDAGAVVDVGTVYMYKLEGSAWNLKQKVQIGTAQARDTIASVAISGNRMIIGSPAPNPNAQGNAYYYTLTGDVWSLGRQISPPVSQADQAFGQKVAISASQIFIGAPSFNSGGQTKSGAVYVYNSDGSSLVQTLVGAGTAYTAFGTAIAVDGSVLAVGAPQALGREAQGNGSVYVYTNSGTWSQAAVKTGTQAAETFGASVAVYGNRLAVGSPNYATGANSAQGRVTFFNSYADAASTNTKNGAATGDRLGTGIALSSTGLYVGTPGANARAGRVDHYLYTNIGSVYYRNIAYNTVGNADFGSAVAVSGSDVVIGSRIRNDPNDNSGAAFVYRYK